MISTFNLLDTLEPFFDDGRITEVLYSVKSGKEATVYCCQAGSFTGRDVVAAKIYRPRESRSFKNDAVYHEGRVILEGHVRRAVAKKSAFGREAQFGMWIGHEYETLGNLAAVGARVPHPMAIASNALLMDMIGDADGPAPALKNVTLEHDEAYRLFHDILNNIELFLAHNIIHGDLSPYNILYWQGNVTIIDFPQAIDPRFNQNARDLLQRDITNVCRYFDAYLPSDPEKITHHLWDRYVNADL